MRKGLKRYRPAMLLLAGLLAAYAGVPRPPLKTGVSLSREFYDREHRLLRMSLSSDDKFRRWVPLERMSPILVEAILLQEDRHFYLHPGVNPASLLKAFWATYVRKERRVGGSTITMQLARMRYGINSRTLPGKLRQMARAMQIERHYSKKEILEAYLNLVPCGGNIEGFGAASLVYFGKDPSALVLPEVLALCVIPKSPARRALLPSRAASSGNEEARRARLRLFDRWLRVHPEDESRSTVMRSPLNVLSASELPFLAPHFVASLIEEQGVEGEILTTLDLPLQRILEQHLRGYVERRKKEGIFNAAAMLVDIRDMGVRAVVGSADFADEKIEGQVNGTRARRSPGSTLKPFIYGLGIEQGEIHPMTMLKDSPMSFGGFNPENFDRDFKGPIHAWEALVRSRNVPAVRVAMRLKDPSLYDFLKTAGVAPLREESHYGLALALGGVEMTMEKLVELYAMLANGGMLRPLRARRDERIEAGKRLLSDAASFIVMDMLGDNPRPGQRFKREWTLDALPVHWKSGTSYAFRDAWAVGVFGPYVLGVWVGNFDGEGNPAFVGASAAAPLFFQMADAIRLHEPGLEPPLRLVGGEVKNIKVCAVSGHIPGPDCKRTTPTLFIPGVSPIKTCDVHRRVFVEKRTGRRACSNVGPGVESVVYEFWPSDLLGLFRRAGIPRRVPPLDNPDCGLHVRSTRGAAPVITSPQADVTYNVRAASADKIPFSAVTDADVRTLYWFVDERFIGKSGQGQAHLAALKPGSYVVRVVDDQGRSDSRGMSVTVVE